MYCERPAFAMLFYMLDTMEGLFLFPPGFLVDIAGVYVTRANQKGQARENRSVSPEWVVECTHIVPLILKVGR